MRSSAKGRQTKSRGPAAALRGDGCGGRQDPQARLRGDPDPARPAAGQRRRRGHHLTKGFDDRMLIDDLSFTLPRNGIVGVIGPNGAGKTTLFKMIIGEEKPDDGEIRSGRR